MPAPLYIEFKVFCRKHGVSLPVVIGITNRLCDISTWHRCAVVSKQAKTMAGKATAVNNNCATLTFSAFCPFNNTVRLYKSFI